MDVRQRQRFEKRIAAMSRRFGEERSQEMLILVNNPGFALGDGFLKAKDYLEKGRSVRFIGHGVTLEDTWPGWVTHYSGVQFAY